MEGLMAAAVAVGATVAVVIVAMALLRSYTSSLFGPPQYSERFPEQSILQPVRPSEAGTPPLEKVLPQSEVEISMM